MKRSRTHIWRGTFPKQGTAEDKVHHVYIMAQENKYSTVVEY